MRADAKKAKTNRCRSTVVKVLSDATPKGNMNSAPDRACRSTKLSATRISFRDSRAKTLQRDILNNNSNADQDEDSIDKRFDTYLKYKNELKDDNGEYFIAAEPELLGPSDDIKVFSGKYYQYDGTNSNSKKKKLRQQNLDKGKTTHIYDG